MIKSELMELLKNIEDDKSIDEVILNNGFAKPLTNIDGFNELLASNKEIQGLVDSKISKGIESFKNNGMQKLIEAEVLKRTNPVETPEQKAIKELQEKLDLMQKEKSKAEMTSKFKNILAQKDIPVELTEFLLGDDEETTNANITVFESSLKPYIDSKVNSRLNNGYKPTPIEATNNDIDDIAQKLNQAMGLK